MPRLVLVLDIDEPKGNDEKLLAETLEEAEALFAAHPEVTVHGVIRGKAARIMDIIEED